MPERKVPQHPLVSRLGKKRTQSEQLTPIVGWQGDADATDRVRVYLDLGFSTYYEFSTDDVVDTVSTDPEDENAPSMVWVRSTANASLTRIQSVTGDIDSLSGGISRANLPRASNVRYASAEKMLPETGWGCPIHTLDPPCTISNLFCPTHLCGPTMESWCTIGSWC